MPTKCGMRKSPPVVDQPVSGIDGPPSGTPTLCAPTTSETPLPPAACCSGVGCVIRLPRAAPASAITAPSRTAQAEARSAVRERKSSTAMTREPIHSVTIVTAMTLNSSASKAVA